MKTVSKILLKDIIKSGTKTFFGVQGGAAAKLIESVIQNGGKFYPVLNEQAAGYYAHGYYMAKKEPAGMIFTTGPGLVNGLSGLAACYYDRVPTTVLVGQVNKKLNIAKKTSTRMVGFQEVPHVDLGKCISDNIFKIDSVKKFKNNRKEIIKSVMNKKVNLIEINDDTQREILKSNSNLKTKKNIEKKIIVSKKFKKAFKLKSKKVFILGAGVSNDPKIDYIIKIVNKTNLNVLLTWGAQNLQNRLKNFAGIFGQHCPGNANKLLEETQQVFAIGASLLQHQVGKKHPKFAPKSKIIFINNDIKECQRAKSQFRKRLNYLKINSSDFFKEFSNLLINNKSENFNSIIAKLDIKDNTPVNTLKFIFSKLKKDYIIFADAGATLSWSYQAANLLKKCPPIYTCFNLHPMGYANCAGVGARMSGHKKILVVIGDGSIPMNSQEFSWLNKFPIKIVVIDNKGYGIIRQTQKDFYKSNFLGSDFINKKSKLPNFSIEKILSSFNLKLKKINNKRNKIISSWFLKNNEAKALIIKTDYQARVSTE